MVDNQPEMQSGRIRNGWIRVRSLFSLEDAAVAAVTRLQEDLPAVAMIPEPTAAVEGHRRATAGRRATGRLQPQ